MIRTLTTIASAAAIGLGAGAIASADQTDHTARATFSHPAVITGCPAEDSCAIDYTHGTWRITRTGAAQH